MDVAGLEQHVKDLRKPIPKPPHLSLATWENRTEFPLYARAIEALEKAPKSVTAKDRKAVKDVIGQLRESANSGSGAREQHFVTSLGVSTVVHRDPVANMINKHLYNIPGALDAFAGGKKPIGNMQQPAIAYLMRRAGLEASEKNMYEAFTKGLKRMQENALPKRKTSRKKKS